MINELCFSLKGFWECFLPPLSVLLIFNREKLELPRYLLILAMLTLLASVFVGIGLIGVIFGSRPGFMIYFAGIFVRELGIADFASEDRGG